MSPPRPTVASAEPDECANGCDVPGEEAWPTQPFPTLPAPLVPDRVAPDSVFGLTAASRDWCRSQLSGLRAEGIFTPPSLHGTVIYPGNLGGSNWSGMAFDPTRHLAIVPSNRLITIVDRIPRADLHERMMGGSRLDEFGQQTGTPYGMHRRHLFAADGAPCSPPPWGTLTAIDLETGAKLWERPFGRVSYLASQPGNDGWRSPNLGGAMITAGGLVFAAGALDQRLHAYDVDSGEELWSAKLPAGVHASPMTYVTQRGRQFVVVAAGGHREFYTASGGRDPVGDYFIAFALPASGSAPRAASRATPVAPGKYSGHFALDRSRYATEWTLSRVRGAKAQAPSFTLSFTLSGLAVEAHGPARVVGDSLFADLTYTLVPRHCGGAMKLHGVTANGGSALIGELEYVDDCSDGRTKPGTFSVRKVTVADGFIMSPR
jgi:hypothetical protein